MIQRTKKQRNENRTRNIYKGNAWTHSLMHERSSTGVVEETNQVSRRHVRVWGGREGGQVEGREGKWKGGAPETMTCPAPPFHPSFHPPFHPVRQGNTKTYQGNKDSTLTLIITTYGFQLIKKRKKKTPTTPPPCNNNNQNH